MASQVSHLVGHPALTVHRPEVDDDISRLAQPKLQPLKLDEAPTAFLRLVHDAFDIPPGHRGQTTTPGDDQALVEQVEPTAPVGRQALPARVPHGQRHGQEQAEQVPVTERLGKKYERTDRDYAEHNEFVTAYEPDRMVPGNRIAILAITRDLHYFRRKSKHEQSPWRAK